MAQIRTVIRDTDHGAKALAGRVARGGRAGGPRLHVGIVGANADAIHEPPPNEDGSPSQAKGTITMGELGTIFELGLGNNPRRSWLLDYLDQNMHRIVQMFNRAGEQVLLGKLTPEAALNLIGLQLVGEIKQRIQSGLQPPLAASTLKRKGPAKTTPLINMGQWIGSINHMVTGGRSAQANG